MHPDFRFRWDDRDMHRVFAREIGFGMLFAQTPDGPRVAHIPFVFLDDDKIGFHVARGNGIARHLDGVEALFVINGPDGYISPDDYGIDDQVPTWNYMTLELQGRVKPMNDAELVAQLDILSREQEEKLAPKPVWTRDKMSDGVFDKMTGAITGFELSITGWRGTAKLGQNKPQHAQAAATEQLDKRGKRALAHLMRTWQE